MLRLVLFYALGGDTGPPRCEWTRIEQGKTPFPVVAGIIRRLPGWERCRLMGFGRVCEPHDPPPIHEARFGRRTDAGIETLTVRYYAGHKGAQTVTRDEFRAYLTTLAGILPSDMMDKFNSFSQDPHTDHAELNHIMELLFAANFEEAVSNL